jgi:hypothetical protein
VFCLFIGLDWSATYSRKNSTRGTLLMAARIAAWPSHWSLRETDRVRRRTCLHEDQRIRANHAGRHSRGPRRRQSYRSLLPRRRPVQPQNGMAVVRRLSSQIGRGERGLATDQKRCIMAVEFRLIKIRHLDLLTRPLPPSLDRLRRIR